MNEITLEKIDIVKERTGVTYAEAKEALELCNGNVVDALIHVEQNQKKAMEGLYTTKDELVAWIKDLVNKGNVSRIRMKKQDKVILDVPLNAGVATGALALIIQPLLVVLGAGAVFALATNITIEITKNDGSVEVVNKIVKDTVTDVKDKVTDLASDIKDKISNRRHNDVNNDVNNDSNVYKYTVTFDDMEEENK